jgi:hypothetical protein
MSTGDETTRAAERLESADLLDEAAAALRPFASQHAVGALTWGDLARARAVLAKLEAAAIRARVAP